MRLLEMLGFKTQEAEFAVGFGMLGFDVKGLLKGRAGFGCFVSLQIEHS